MRRCIMCDEPNPMYLPSDDVDDVGLYSCDSCGFEMEGPRQPAAIVIIAIPAQVVPADANQYRPDVDELLELVPLEGALL